METRLKANYDHDNDQFRVKTKRPGGRGVMTFHDYGYLPPEFLKSYPVSE